MNEGSKSTIRNIYLYLVSVIAIVIMVISAIGIVNLVLTEYVLDVKSYEVLSEPYECTDDYKLVGRGDVDTEGMKLVANKSDETYEECVARVTERNFISHENQVKRDWVTWLSMLIVAFPVFLFHWRIIRKEK